MNKYITTLFQKYIKINDKIKMRYNERKKKA